MSSRYAVDSWRNIPRKYIPAGLKRRIRGVQRRLQSVAGPYYCPVCESRIRRFDPIPAFYSAQPREYGFPYSAEEAETCNWENYSCPFCEANDRDRLSALYLRESIPNHKSLGLTSIVDFAPSAPLSRCVRKLIERTGANISYRTADYFADGIDDRIDIMDMRIYADQQFDCFICSHVLEHVADDRKALRELHRILKPTGKGILLVPIVLTISEIDEDPNLTDESERWRRFGQYDHVRLYSRTGFLDRVREAGFSVDEYNVNYFGDGVFRRNGITLTSVLYVVGK
jgi:SAM-dependent methyltransferase